MNANINTAAELSATEKAAYNKGWGSQAKTADGARAAFVKVDSNFPAGADGESLIAFFLDGYADKRAGAAKWAAYAQPEATEAPEAEPTLVTVDDVTVAEARHLSIVEDSQDEDDHEDGDVVPLTDTPAVENVPAEIPDLAADRDLTYGADGDENDEDDAKLDAELATADTGDYVSITAMQAIAGAEADMTARGRIRREIQVKKAHYKRGWTAATAGDQSDLSRDDALMAYAKGRKDLSYRNDFLAGYDDKAAGAAAWAWKK